MTEEQVRKIVEDVIGSYSDMTAEMVGAIRRAIPQTLFASKIIDFGSVGAGGNTTEEIPVAGAELSDPVVLGIPNSSENAGISYKAWVSSAGVVTIRIYNHSGGAIDLASGLFKVAVLKQ